MNSTNPIVNPSKSKAQLSPELESVVREEVAARLKVWGIVAGAALLALQLPIAYFWIELRQIKADALRMNQPVMIYNSAWDTTIDAVDPAIFPGTHRDDVRKGTRVQQWPAHGGPQQIWEFRHPYGSRYQSNAPVAVP